ncbi:hypothetical protein BaRGS_00005879 [Batillaria attramentaria]|uniref:Carbohydrate sulfotransferase n=1 Tax=Batillaria attramentaria TaxID=370345 RepID=A0ABD0LTT0_9CAEN
MDDVGTDAAFVLQLLNVLKPTVLLILILLFVTSTFLLMTHHDCDASNCSHHDFHLILMLLPDFWRNVGVQAITRYRKDPTDKAKRCGHDVTFTEFVQFALTTENSHWEPIHRRCDPCRFQPQIIADMDTFSRDSEVILKRMGLDSVLHELNRTGQRELELRTLIDYNFDLINTTNHYQGCITQTELAYLLWKVFQINGYLPVQTLFSLDKDKGPFSFQDFKNHVIGVFRESAHMHEKLKRQKRHFMEDAYRSLSPELIDKLRAVFKLDFQLFGYDDSPFT